MFDKLCRDVLNRKNGSNFFLILTGYSLKKFKEIIITLSVCVFFSPKILCQISDPRIYLFQNLTSNFGPWFLIRADPFKFKSRLVIPYPWMHTSVELGENFKPTLHKELLFVTIARGEGGHTAVVHILVQGSERSSPAGDGRGAGCCAWGRHWRGDQTERCRTDHSTDRVHWRDTRVCEHLQVHKGRRSKVRKHLNLH